MTESSCDGGADNHYVCPACQTRTTSVPTTTLLHLLEPPQAREVNPEQAYGVCRERSCPLLYFSSDHRQTWKPSDVRTLVGFKQPRDAPSHPVCYCFGYIEENIAEEIKATGKSKVVEWITKRVQNEECACEYKNPLGRCCLGNLREVVKNSR